MNLWVIIPAAGSSRRYHQASAAMGVDRSGFSKLDEDLGGRPVLQRTVELFIKHDGVAGVVVAGPADEEAYQDFKRRHGDKLGMLGVKTCQGGANHRYETVALALKHVPSDATHVAVHDAARPCTPLELIDRMFDAAGKHAAVIPGLPASDTLKRVGEAATQAADHDPLAAILGNGPASDGGAGAIGGGGSSAGGGLRPVVETVDRAGLMAVQTPQIFEAGLLRRAYAQKDLTSTDDAQLVERLDAEVSGGAAVMVIPGDARNIKITTPTDMLLARAILGVKGPEAKSAHLRF